MSAPPKSCPFCGREPTVKEFHFIDDLPSDPPSVMVWCHDADHDARTVKATEADAVEAWNRRAH